MAFLLEEALKSGAEPSRGNECWTFIAETPITGAHIHLDDDEDGPKATLPFQHASGSEHREDSDKDERSALKQGGVSHSEYLEFLCTNSPTFLTRSLDDKQKISNVLLMMADNVMRAQAPAAAEQPEWDILDMRLWYVSLCELIKEMTMVQEQTPSVMDKSGVYVITSSPYDAFELWLQRSLIALDECECRRKLNSYPLLLACSYSKGDSLRRPDVKLCMSTCK